jgi:hypothetical protein
VKTRRSPLPRQPDLPGPPVLGFVACGAVVRRSAYLAVGGFSPVVFFLGEETLLAQAAEFQQQKQLSDAAAERDRATRRAMLSEATQAFAVQVEGLREILDGLRVEAAAVDGTLPSESVKSAVDILEGRADGAADAAKPVQAGEPATAALEKEGVLE